MRKVLIERSPLGSLGEPLESFPVYVMHKVLDEKGLFWVPLGVRLESFDIDVDIVIVFLLLVRRLIDKLRFRYEMPLERL